MICGSWITGEYFNYRFAGDDMVELWNLTTDSTFVSYERWLEEYYIKDKWGSI